MSRGRCGRRRGTTSRPSPPRMTTSPLLSLKETVRSSRRAPPTRNRQSSPSETETTGRGEVGLVAILVQAHLRAIGIEVDQAGLRRMRIGRDGFPEPQKRIRYRRPGFLRHRMRRLVAIAAFLVGDPAERAAIGHAHAHFLAGARHGRHVERRGLDYLAHILDQRFLRRPVEIARHVPHAFRQNLHSPALFLGARSGAMRRNPATCP